VVLLGLLAALGLTVALGLRACSLLDAGPSPESSLPGARATGSIVSLGHGRTMVAPRGTVAADLVEWLTSGAEGERYFEAGGREFIGNSAELAPDAWNRIERFVMMLQANHDVRARIVGYSDASGNDLEDQRLSEERAHQVMIEIAAHGIAPSRLSFEGRGSANPVADNATPAGRARNRRVAVILSRGR
jgi:outer membrane protein OmpA-like peptidoglycan-associated protein